MELLMGPEPSVVEHTAHALIQKRVAPAQRARGTFTIGPAETGRQERLPTAARASNRRRSTQLRSATLPGCIGGRRSRWECSSSHIFRVQFTVLSRIRRRSLCFASRPFFLLSCEKRTILFSKNILYFTNQKKEPLNTFSFRSGGENAKEKKRLNSRLANLFISLISKQ